MRRKCTHLTIHSFFLLLLSFSLSHDSEINRVRSTLFQITGNEKKPLMLPDPDGPVVSKSDKILVPIDKHPEVSSHILLFHFSPHHLYVSVA
jgi:hypothetical protein